MSGTDFPLRLGDAANIAVSPFDAAFKIGVKIALSGWHAPAAAAKPEPGLILYRTICLLKRILVLTEAQPATPEQ